MNTTELKSKYKVFLGTDEAQPLISQSVMMAIQWREIMSRSNIHFDTKGVNVKKINKKLQTRISLLPITPIGLVNQCHTNTRVFAEECGMEKVLGFNICACPCGRFMNYELHSVNRKDGMMCDLTKDFDNLREKYFLELKTNMTALEYINKYGRYKTIASINKGCSCKVDWNTNGVWDIDEHILQEHIKEIEDNA